MTRDPLSLDFDRLDVGAALRLARAHDHRGRPGLVLGAHRRLAPPARRRRVGGGEPVRRADRARDAGALLRGRPAAVRPRAGRRAARPAYVAFKRPVPIGDTIRSRPRSAAAAPARRRAWPGRARPAGARRRGQATRARGARGALATGAGHRGAGERQRQRPGRGGALDRATRGGCCSDPRRQAAPGHRRRSTAAASPTRSPREAQLAGAEVVLTSFGRMRRLTERAAKRLPEPPEVLELDVNSDDDLAAVAAELDVALGTARRRPARDRLRARRRPRRRLPADPARERDRGLRDQRLLAAGARPAPRAAARARSGRRRHRRARLRRLRRLARLRLDGRRQGGARVGRSLSGPRSRPARGARQPRLRRAGRDRRRRRHPGLR